jgi:hypothetical protein
VGIHPDNPSQIPFLVLIVVLFVSEFEDFDERVGEMIWYEKSAPNSRPVRAEARGQIS